ncbi:MAG: hypothetical protein MUE44_34895 [Oscillatoriaceae cyanobacterium Prado104]|nr:hypothetical protein [Oscillatoriaceae cyanobacterium Prado104]
MLHTRRISKELVIFDCRIDKISKTVGKDPSYIFTMSQLRLGMAEFLVGSSRKEVIESRSNQQKNEFKLLLDKAKIFYTQFAQINEAWQSLLQPASKTVNLDLYKLRQERLDFNSVGFQVISRVGYFIFFGNEFSQEQQNILVEALAKLDYQRTSPLWQNSLVIDDGNGNKKIIAQMAAIDKGFKIVVREVESQTGIKLK